MMLPSPTELGSISLPYKGILGGSFYSSVALFRGHKLEGNALGIQWFGLRAFTAKAWILSLVREPRSWQTAWSGQNKTHKLREKKNPWFGRECQGRSSGTARHSCSNLREDHMERAVLGPAPGLVHMGACRGGITPWASPSLLSQAPRAPKHEPQGLLKHLSESLDINSTF